MSHITQNKHESICYVQGNPIMQETIMRKQPIIMKNEIAI